MALSSRQHCLQLLISAVLLSVLAACGGPSRDIVGKWQTSAGSNAVVWEFARNGLVVIGGTRGKYSLGDGGGRVKVEMPFGTSVYHVQILHDHMTFRDSTGSQIQFSRIK